MSVEKLETLESRVRKLLDLVVELRQDKSHLEQELETTRERLAKHEEMSEGWEEERTTIRSRIEKVLGELEFLDRSND
ncbi:MAG: cell division protein ZapB [Nitrospirota bacterium]|nr:cell division protein ZapB [Nitrospirota bacterium]MDH4360020.1 cell division protein ZapB [Nitrospirota bacterium]MDH5295508.1 cell division protein ZapB [Nitrospirota bacterium]MDH5575838.1 cell division protein ZapB [Nitrospirota bacterium]